MKRTIKTVDEVNSLFETADGKPLLEVLKRNAEGKRLCKVEGCHNRVRNKGKNHGGEMDICQSHYNGYNTSKEVDKWGYRKKDYCENIDGRLGFYCLWTRFPDRCFATKDHIDNDHNHEHPSNWQTLCAGCHSYKGKYFGHSSYIRDVDTMLRIFDQNRITLAAKQLVEPL